MGKQPVEHIACITDLTPATLPAFHHALALALAARARLTLLHIGPEHNDDVDWSAFPRVRDTLARWGRLAPDAPKSAVANELGIEVRKMAFRDHSLLQGLKAFTRQHHTDLVVACAPPPGIRLLHEAGAEGILRDNLTHLLWLPRNKPGFVEPDDGHCTLTGAVLPVTSHPDPHDAVRLTGQLLPALTSPRPRATLLHVGTRASAPEIQPDASSMDWQWQFEEGRVTQRIQACVAAQGAQLLVMPSGGRPGLWQAMRRSHTEKLLHQAPCPLLAVASG